MDFATIAHHIVGVLTPYLVKGADEFLQTVGSTAVEKTKKLLGRLKTWFAHDAEASAQLSAFENQPNERREDFQEALRKKLENDTEMAGSLEKDVSEIIPVLEVFQKISNSEDVTGGRAKRVDRGNIKITQEGTGLKKVTGFDFDQIG